MKVGEAKGARGELASRVARALMKALYAARVARFLRRCVADDVPLNAVRGVVELCA